jgi:diguanylate cyclase (GGDEF)-like protein
MATQLFRMLDGAKPAILHLLCLFMIASLGVLDHLTGFEFSFSIFYLGPIYLASWYLRGPACYVYSFLAAGVWGGSNFLAGETLSHPMIHVWNGLVRLGFFALTAYLVQRLRRLFDREREMSRRDYQTGLLNGAGFQERLLAEHSRSVRKGRPLGLVFIDLDNFKSVNDTLGHAEGDRVLTSVAATLKRQLRLSDSVARLGGDEFAVILPECPKEHLNVVAAKLVESVRELSKENGWPVSASVGGIVLDSPKGDDDLKAFLKSADELMYRVKEKGRDGYLIE